MPRRLTEDATTILNVAVPNVLRLAIDEWALSHGIKRSEAARLLLERGLNATAWRGQETKPSSSRPRPSACRHPIPRRLGGVCMECGAKVGR